MANVYFELTEELNRHGPIAALSSGQAVVYYRLAIMSKDGDWVIRETTEACLRTRSVLGGRGARMRPSAPLDIRWLEGGWSSHFEFSDERGRRIRCDFVSRPPRVSSESVEAFWAQDRTGLRVVDVESLVRMKQTQRAKDYAVIGEVARLLRPEEEIELTTDPDRILELVKTGGVTSSRPAVRAALERRGREAIVIEIAREVDRLAQADRARVQRYQAAGDEYVREFRRRGLSSLPLSEVHERSVELALQLLPFRPLEGTG